MAKPTPNTSDPLTRMVMLGADFYYGQSPDKIHLRNVITEFNKLPPERTPELVAEYRTKIANFYTSLEDPNSPIPQADREFWKTQSQNALNTLNKLSLHGRNALREEDYMSLAPFMDVDPARRLTQLQLNQYRRQQQEQQAAQATQATQKSEQKQNPWEFWKRDEFWNSMMASFIMQLLFRR